MEALLTLAFAGWLGKKTVEAVVGGGNKRKEDALRPTGID